MKEVPIWEKSNLTLEEAAAYSGIGINKLRLLSDNEKSGRTEQFNITYKKMFCFELICKVVETYMIRNTGSLRLE